MGMSSLPMGRDWGNEDWIGTAGLFLLFFALVMSQTGAGPPNQLAVGESSAILLLPPLFLY